MSDNLIREKHLTSLGSAVKHYVDNNISGGSSILDSVPSTLNGSLWYEVQNDSPVIKFYQGGHSFSINPTIDTVSPNLTVSPPSATISAGDATASVSVSGANTTYNSSTKIISVPYDSTATGQVKTASVSLGASRGYSPASASFAVTMQPPQVPPDLSNDFSVYFDGNTITDDGDNTYRIPIPADSNLIEIGCSLADGSEVEIEIVSVTDGEDNPLEDIFSWYDRVISNSEPLTDIPLPITISFSANNLSGTIILQEEE